jgi:hypothetical protein
MKRCARCEIDHEDSAPFCIACGGALDTIKGGTATAKVIPVDGQAAAAGVAPVEPETKSRIKILPVAVSLAVALLIILVVAHYNRGVTLTLRTLPGGTAVFLDGRAMGTTGLDGYLTIGHLHAGKHTIALQHGGYTDLKQDFTVHLYDLSKSLELTMGQFGTEVPSISTKPADAYKALYAAVKAKDTDAIKSHLSESTIEVMTAAGAAQRRPFADVIANGLTESTAAATLPELCQDRIKGRFGALEVKRTDGKWEDLPWVIEDGQWKLAAGEMFKGAYRSPGDPICVNAAPSATP